MLLNYDPDSKPVLTPNALTLAKENGLHPVCVICDEKGARVGDATGLSFTAVTSFVPRVGDRIVLERGEQCRVENVYFRVVTSRDANGKADAVMLVPTVHAKRMNGP